MRIILNFHYFIFIYNYIFFKKKFFKIIFFDLLLKKKIRKNFKSYFKLFVIIRMHIPYFSLFFNNYLLFL